MNDFALKINDEMKAFENIQCIVELEGPVSTIITSNIEEYQVNKYMEFELKINGIKLNINLSEMYDYEFLKEEIRIYLDNGNKVIIKKK